MGAFVTGDRARERNAEIAEARKGQPLSPDPVAEARAAAQRGEHLFQVEIAHSALVGTVGRGMPAQRWQNNDVGRVLTEVERAGWKLEHVNWLFVETVQGAEVQPFSGLFGGAETSVGGYVTGVYLFRRQEF